MIQGIDVSAVQGTINWKTVAEFGIRFAWCKATEGANYTDPTALRNLDGCREADIPCGAYLFARVGQDPVAQVKRLWDSVGAVMPNLPVGLDFESMPHGYDPAKAVQDAEALVSEIRAYFGRSPFLYTYPSFARGIGAPLARSETLASCKLWIAHYRWLEQGPPPESLQPDIPPPWKHWTVWQYSGNGGARVPGIAVDVDRNVFHGDEDQFRFEMLGLDADLA